MQYPTGNNIGAHAPQLVTLEHRLLITSLRNCIHLGHMFVDLGTCSSTALSLTSLDHMLPNDTVIQLGHVLGHVLLSW